MKVIKMIFKFKKLTDTAKSLTKDEGNCGYDLTAISKTPSDLYTEYGTGLAVEIPNGYAGLIFPRSSQSKYGMILANCVGVVDPSYRGEVKCRFKKIQDGPDYAIGEKVAQLVIVPMAEPIWEETENLTKTDRGDGGFGSTGQ